jgi:hypothetical protein
MSVVIRKVKTALQSEYRKAGGLLVDDAVAQAGENLESLAEQGAERIDVVLGVVMTMTADPHRQLTAAELRKLHVLVNEMLACCATVEIEGFVEALYAVGRLLGAMMVAEGWLDGALTSAVNLLRLVRRGAVARDDLKVLIAGVDQCAHRISDSHRLTTYR